MDNWDYQRHIFGLMLVEILFIVFGLIAAKNNKQNTVGHLFAGCYLLLVGCMAIMLFDSSLVFIELFAKKQWIGTDGLVKAKSWLLTMKYIFPVISIAFGTRFIGNWVIADKKLESV